MKPAKLQLYVKLVAVAVVAIGFAQLYAPQKALAGTLSDVLPNDGTKLILSDPNGAGFNLPVSVSYIYVPTATAQGSVQLIDLSNEINNGGAIRTMTVGTVTSAGGCRGGDVAIRGVGNGAELEVPNNTSIVFNQVASGATLAVDGYNMYCVTTTVMPETRPPCPTALRPVCGYINVTFRLRSGAGSLVGSYPGSISSSGQGYYRDLSSSGVWTKEIDFARPCSASGSILAEVIRLYDLDTNSAVNSGMRIEISEADRNSGATFTPLPLQNPTTKPSGIPGFGINVVTMVPDAGTYRYFPSSYPSNVGIEVRPKEGFQQNKKYRLRITGIAQNNKIRIRIPYDELSVNTDCTPPTCPDYGFTGGTGGSGGGGPGLSAPGFTAQTISSSSDASNRVCQINMQDYRDYINVVNWPLRSDGCSPQTGYKPFPLVPDSRQFAIGPYSGNVFNLSGSCSSTFDDGGSSAGAWMKPGALGGWAADVSSFSGYVPYAGSSGKLSRCPANAKIVWGRSTIDDVDQARPLFDANGTVFPSTNPLVNYDTTSNGTTILRNNFVLSQAQLDSLNDLGTLLSLRIVADDFYQVYINGSLVITENNTASPTSTDLTSSKSLFRLGNNSIAIQAVDKLVWRNNTPSLANTGFGLCYSLDLLRPITQADPAESCSLTPIGFEPGTAYYPRIRFTNSLSGTATATINVNFSIDGLAGSDRTVSGISLPAPVSPATSVVRTAYVTSPDFTPQAGDVAFTADTPISLPTPGSYTARYDWSWTAGSYSGPPAPVAPATTNDCVVTIIVASRPYFKALGDVITQDPASVINGWNQALGGLGYEATFPVNAGGNFGAGAQGMILSAGPTTGVASRFRNTGGNPRSFTLANTTPPGDLTWGGNFGSPLLMPAPLLDNLTPVDTTNSIAGIASGMYSLAGGTLTGGVIAPGRQVTIYVNGDVRIVSGGGSGITYANSNSYPNRTTIPRFRLIATGSIYIDPGVTQLDGEYIAGNGGSGNIYTCFAAGWSAPLDGTTENPYGVCGGTLIVNGALLADSIKLTRAVGTLRGAQANDADLLLVGPTDYQNASNISEIIQFTPELFLVNPAGPPSDSSPNRYDSITALPPLF